MTITNVSRATSGTITPAFGNSGEFQRSNALSSARITQNSPESLRAPVAGKVLFRVLEETRASDRVRPVFNIFESSNETGEKSYQITMSDDLRDVITMKLEVPAGENLETVQNKIMSGEYKVKISDKSKGEPVCHLVESVRLKGGGERDPGLSHAAFKGYLYDSSNPQENFIRALEYDYKNSAAYYHLGKTLEPKKTAFIRSNPKYGLSKPMTLTQRDCFKKALKYDPRNLDAYACLKSLDLKALELDLKNPDTYMELANTLKPEDIVQVQGQNMNQQELKAKAQELKEKKAKLLQRRKDADYCFDLGFNLKPGKTVRVWEQDMTKQACFLKALELNPKHSAAFASLGLTLKPKETVRVGEQDMTALDCCLTALDLNPNSDAAFNNLGTVLEQGTTVEIEGQHMDKQACFLEALRLNPENDMAFVNLGTTLLPTDDEVKINGKKINQRECYLEALCLNPENDTAYINLGNTLLTLDEKVRIGGGWSWLTGGERLNKRECYLKALKLNPHSTSAYQQLGMTLQEHETVYVFGKEMTKQECFKKAKELGLNNGQQMGASTAGGSSDDHDAQPSSSTQNIESDANHSGLNQPSSSFSSAQPDQPKIELTSEQYSQVIALLGHAKAIELLGDAINIDDAKKNGGPKVLNQSEYKVIMNTCEEVFEEVKKLKQNQNALRSAFEKIMGDHPKDLTESQQKYFHAFLGAMQHFFIVSNALASQKFQTKVEMGTPIEVLGVAAEQTSEAVAAGLPVAGVVFKGAAWLISQLLENRLINHLSPFAQLFQTPNQCAVVAHALAEQLARIREPKIQSAYIKDTPVSTTLAQRCKAVFEKYHIQTKEPDKVDKLAMKDVQKLVKRIYSFEQGKTPVTVNGTAYGYKDLQKAIGSDDGRRQVINLLLNLMGWSMPVQTGSASQSASQNSHQNQNRDEVGISTQFMHKELERLRELDSKVENIDVKIQRLLNQQQKASSGHETFVTDSGNGQQQMQALAAEKHLRDHAHSMGGDKFLPSLYKDLLQYQELSNLLATKVSLLEEAIGNMSPSSSNLQPRINAEAEGDDSGLDTDDERNNRLAAIIKRNRTDKFQRALDKASEETLNRPVTRTRRTHIRSTPLDIAAHYGRDEMANELEERGADSLRHGSPLEAVEVAERRAREVQNAGRQ